MRKIVNVFIATLAISLLFISVTYAAFKTESNVTENEFIVASVEPDKAEISWCELTSIQWCEYPFDIVD